MKKILLVALILFSSGNALAAEVSIFAGPYVGVDVGYSKGDIKGYETTDGAPYGYGVFEGSNSSFIFGGLAGHNLSLSNGFVLGFEADFENRNVKKTNLLLPELVDALETKIKKAGSVRVRLGRVFNSDKTMAYLTGGYAAADISKNYTLSFQPFSQSQWQSGFTAGFGIEHFVNDAISFKTEYRYSDYGKSSLDNITLGSQSGNSEHFKYDNEHSFRLGLIYHF